MFFRGDHMIHKREIRDCRIQLLTTPTKAKIMKTLASAAGVSVNELINIAIDRLIETETAHDTPAFRSIFDEQKTSLKNSEHQLDVEEVIASHRAR